MDYILNTSELKKQLIRNGFKSVAEFASKTGIHRNTLNNLINGKSVLSSSMRAVADFFKVDPMQLIKPTYPLHLSIPDIQELESVISYLVLADKDLVITLIGSRATNNFKKYSDWDLGLLKYPSTLSGRDFLKLKSKVEDLSEDLPRKIDCINLNQAPNWFWNELKQTPLFLAGSKESYSYLKGIYDGINQKQKTT